MIGRSNFKYQKSDEGGIEIKPAKKNEVLSQNRNDTLKRVGQEIVSSTLKEQEKINPKINKEFQGSNTSIIDYHPFLYKRNS